MNELTGSDIDIRPVREDEVATLLQLIRELAEYEKMLDECILTEELLRGSIFRERPAVEACLIHCGAETVGYILYFQNYSTFLGKPGLYLEDLYVRPAFRRRGIGRASLRYLARICRDRDYGRMEWSALKWNELANSQYRKTGAVSMDEWHTWRLTGDPLAALAGESD